MKIENDIIKINEGECLCDSCTKTKCKGKRYIENMKITCKDFKLRGNKNGKI